MCINAAFAGFFLISQSKTFSIQNHNFRVSIKQYSVWRLSGIIFAYWSNSFWLIVQEISMRFSQTLSDIEICRHDLHLCKERFRNWEYDFSMQLNYCSAPFYRSHH